MRIVIQSMQANYFLQVCMLFDKKETGKQCNLVVDRVIYDFDFPEETVGALEKLKKNMLPFVNSLRKFRNKLGAHIDYQNAVYKSSRRLGKYKQQDEQIFFASLLDFMRVADTALNQVTGIEWSTSHRDDAEQFMKILVDAGAATPDPVMEII